MASFNKVILAGNLTRDPQLSYTASNTAVCKFGMAMNRKWKDREEVCYVDCTAFGRGGEIINQYMTKGQSILVEGRLNYGQWEDQQGNRRSKLDVVVENFQFLGGPKQGGGQPVARSGSRSGSGAPMHHDEGPPMDDYGPPVTDDDVPF